jgi:hypothetical protein
MVATNRLLIQVVPRLQPTRCGVSDHAIALASELRTSCGIDSAFVVLNSNEPSDVPYSVVHRSPDQLLNACISLSENYPAAILVHLSGYGYSADGAPTLLAEALRRVRADGRFRVAVFFHELFATGMPWKSAFWYSRRQKRVVRRIAEACDLLLTNTRFHADWLERETVRQTASPIQCMPVFSHVEEAQERVPLSDRNRVMAVFGLEGTRKRVYKELSALGTTLGKLGIQQIVDIGPGFEPPGEVGGIPVKPRGALPAAEIAKQFSQLTFGYISCTPLFLAKSGVLAGYSAHGVIPVIAQHFRGEIDGLKDGVQVLSPQTAKRAEPAGLEACSIAAWHWYRGHRLHDHASIYDHWLEAADAARQSVERKHA